MEVLDGLWGLEMIPTYCQDKILQFARPLGHQTPNPAPVVLHFPS